MGDDVRYLVVHSLKVKGVASEEDLAEITGRDGLVSTLEELTEQDLVKFRTGRIGGYTLTKAGREAHAKLADVAVTDEVQAGVSATYEAFLAVNGQFKEICTRWQVRTGPDGEQAPNDHADAQYDASIIADLGTVHTKVVEALVHAIDVSPRFGMYPTRFEAALKRVQDGDVSAFARPMSASYHDVWMELHEDLLLTLRREREASDGH